MRIESCEPRDVLILVPAQEMCDVPEDSHCAFVLAQIDLMDEMGYDFIDYGEEHEHHTELWFTQKR